jgi:catechol 2,3-dioxygenase-like lactoylglutathione lyase family enzyme
VTDRLRLAGVFFDVPPDLEEAAVDFWSSALGADAVRSGIRDPYTLLKRPGQEIGLEVQRLGDGMPRIHIDFEVDDVDAEADRLEGLGATKVSRIETWWVMKDPAGIVFCLVPK